MIDLDHTLQAVTLLLKKVSQFQLGYFRAMPDDATDIKALRETVSFVDVESEKMLLEGKQGSQDLTWVVDPLDGTTNFLSGLDHFSISVALVENGKAVLGAVCKPFSGEIFSSVKGGGVFYNGVITKPTNPNPDVADALFMTGFPYRSPQVAEGFFKTAASVLTLGRGIRRSGSAALDVAHLSMGWLQGFWETDLQPYDIAAGLLMLEENGILATNGQGEPFDMFKDRLFVAGAPAVHEELLKGLFLFC